MGLRVAPRTSGMAGKCSLTELHFKNTLAGNNVCKPLEKCQDRRVVHNNREVMFGGSSAICPTLGATVEHAQVLSLLFLPFTPIPILSGPGSPPVALCSLWPTWCSPPPRQRPAASGYAMLQGWQGLPSWCLACACKAVWLRPANSLSSTFCLPCPSSSVTLLMCSVLAHSVSPCLTRASSFSEPSLHFHKTTTWSFF